VLDEFEIEEDSDEDELMFEDDRDLKVEQLPSFTNRISKLNFCPTRAIALYLIGVSY
jgi:hypothetical protein